jgi:hypothetical protein
MSRIPDVPKSFADQVRERLSTGHRLGALLESAATPAILRMLGFPNAPLTMSPSVLFKLASGKGDTRSPLSERQIAHLPEAIDDPVLVLQEQDATVVVLSDTSDRDGNPVVVYVRAGCFDGVRVVNSIRTAFGKNRADEWLRRRIDALVYMGEKTNPRLTLPTPICNPAGALETEGLRQNILRPVDLRNYRTRMRSEKLSGSVLEQA